MSHSDRFKLDKLYTRDDIALQCVSTIPNLLSYDLIIEPSAGAASFIRALHSSQYPHTIKAYDIQPESPLVEQQDWLQLNSSSFPAHHRILVLGNPPFGLRNQLSIDFIKKATSIPNVITIAFILPNVFNKHTLQSRINPLFKLTHITPLPHNSFHYQLQPYHIPASFFIFSLEGNTDLRMNSALYLESSHFTFATKNDYDFYVMGAAPHVVKATPEPNNRGYYLKVKPHIPFELVINNFKTFPWKNHSNSSASGGVAWLTKAELVRAYDTELARSSGSPSTPSTLS